MLGQVGYGVDLPKSWLTMEKVEGEIEIYALAKFLLRRILLHDVVDVKGNII